MRFWCDLREAKHFAGRVVPGGFDILHSHSPLAYALAGLEFKRRHGLPMVHEAHAIMRDYAFHERIFRRLMPLNRLIWRLGGRMLEHFERQIVLAAEQVIAQTHSSRRRLIMLYGLEGKPIEVIPNGVDTEAFDPQRTLDKRGFLRRKHNWTDRTVCLYAGFFNAVNGIDFLLRTIPRLDESMRRKLKFVLVGDGPFRCQVEKTVERHGDVLEFLGMVPYQDIPGYYSAADVFIIPRPGHQLGEDFLPVKLLEAMAMEKLVLVSDVAAMAEVVADGRNGLLFEKGSADGFLGKLKRIVGGHDSFDELGRRARQDVRAGYAWTASRKKLQRVYEALVSGRGVSQR